MVCIGTMALFFPNSIIVTAHLKNVICISYISCYFPSRALSFLARAKLFEFVVSYTSYLRFWLCSMSSILTFCVFRLAGDNVLDLSPS